jgi:hypothetical protein
VQQEAASRNANYDLSLKVDKTFTFYAEGGKVTGKWSTADHVLSFSPIAVDGKSIELVRREGKVYESLARYHVQSASQPPLDPMPIIRARALEALQAIGSLTPDSDENRLTQAAPKGQLQVYFTRRA